MFIHLKFYNFIDKKERILKIRSFHLLDKKVDMKRLKKAIAYELDGFREYLGAEKMLAGKVRL